MALLAVEGIYENGNVELAEKPKDVGRARVVVTFLPEESGQEADEARKRRAAGQRLLDSMKKGVNFGGIKFNRDEMYEERMRELEERRGR